MKSLWDNPWFTIPYLLLLSGGLLWLTVYPLGYELVALNPFRQEPLNTFFRFCTHLGEPAFWITIGLLSFYANRRYPLLFGMVAAIMWPFSLVIKHYIGVPRPIAWLEGNHIVEYVTYVPNVKLLSGFNSMPSGHTMLAFAMFSLATLMLPYRYRFLGLLFVWTAALVGISRVFLVQHFMRDIVAGSVFGILISDLVWQLYRKWRFG